MLQLAVYGTISEAHDEEFKRICEHLYPAGSRAAEFQVVIPATEAQEATSAIENIVRALSQLSEKSDTILIDVAVDDQTARAISVVDIVLTESLRTHLATVRSTLVNIVMDRAPAVVDELRPLIADPQLAGRIKLYLKEESVSPNGLDAIFLGSRPFDRQKRVRASTLRARGVFAGTAANAFYKFNYTALPAAHKPVIEAICEELLRLAADVVIYNRGSTGAWFDACVQAAVGRLADPPLAVNAKRLGGVIDPAEERVHAKARELLAGGACSLIVPAFRTGQAIINAYHALGGSESQHNILALFADRDKGDDFREGMYRTVLTEPSGEIRLSYLVHVPLQVLSPNSWEVFAAQQLGEVLDSGRHRESVGCEVAHWSLLSDLGSSREKRRNPARARARTFPKIRDLTDFDARWLVGALLTQVSERLNQVQSRTVFVTPKDPKSGVTRLEAALRDQAYTTIIPIPREVVDGDVKMAPELKSQLAKIPKESKIVLLDEAALTGNTLRKLREVVQRRAHRLPDASVALFDMSETGCCPGLDLSLIQWRLFRRTVS